MKGEKTSKDPTSVLKCDCANTYQDEKYGTGMRVHNRMAEKGGSHPYRCTVCGKVKTKGGTHV